MFKKIIKRLAIRIAKEMAEIILEEFKKLDDSHSDYKPNTF